MYEIQLRPLDRTLLKTALEDLLNKVSDQGDFYCVSQDIESLIELLEELN